ncbi:hypothetical protein N2152v2_000257 [Parachlorella kessleri]
MQGVMQTTAKPFTAARQSVRPTRRTVGGVRCQAVFDLKKAAKDVAVAAAAVGLVLGQPFLAEARVALPTQYEQSRAVEAELQRLLKARGTGAAPEAAPKVEQLDGISLFQDVILQVKEEPKAEAPAPTKAVEEAPAPVTAPAPVPTPSAPTPIFDMVKKTKEATEEAASSVVEKAKEAAEAVTDKVKDVVPSAPEVPAPVVKAADKVKDVVAQAGDVPSPVVAAKPVVAEPVAAAPAVAAAVVEASTEGLNPNTLVLGGLAFLAVAGVGALGSQQQQQGGEAATPAGSTSSASNGAEASPEQDAAKRKAEAKAWIEAWRSKAQK